MATALQNLIDAYIKRNANQEITGPVLNGVLTAIANALGTPFVGSDGYWYTYDAESGQFVKTDTPAQGETGPVGVTEAAATIDDQIGTPSVAVSLNGTRLDFTFRNLKGQKGDTGDAGITAAVVTVDAGIGTPSVDASISGTTLTLAFHNLKGETGAAAGFGTIEATVDDTTGTPAVVVTASGPDTAKNLSFAFSGLKGGKGDQGNTGSSVDYPYELVNNVTTDDPTKGLSAAQGVVLQGEIDQLGQEVTDLDGQINDDPGVNYEEGKCVKANGVIADNATWGLSDFVPYTQGNNVEWKYGGNASGTIVIQFYDNEKNAINGGYWSAGGSGGIQTITADRIGIYAANAAFLRASYRLATEDPYVKIGDNVAWTPTETQPGLKYRIQRLENALPVLSEKADIYIEYYIDSTSPLAGCVKELYIPETYLDGVSKVRCRSANGTDIIISAYDANGSNVWFGRLFEPAQNGVVQEIPCVTAGGNASVGDSVGYIVFSDAATFIANATTSDRDNQSIKIPYTQLRFCPQISCAINSENNSDDIAISLQPDIYAVEGDNLQLFHKSIVNAVNYKDCSVVVSCEYGKNYPRYYELKPTASQVGTTKQLVYQVRNNKDEILAQKSVNLHIIAKPTGNQIQKNLLVLGDSIFTDGTITAELNRRLTTATGYGTPLNPTGLNLANISFVGRKEVNGIHQEASGGWGWKKFATGDFKIIRYNVTGVDQINLGDTYRIDGVAESVTYYMTIVEINIIDGVGNILCDVNGGRVYTESDIPASGNLIRLTGNGDSSISYTARTLEEGNPLWYNNAIDFQHYADTYCGGAEISAILTNMGVNDFRSKSDIDNKIDDYVKPLIRAYHAAYPNGKFYIGSLPLQDSNGGVGAILGASALLNWYSLAKVYWYYLGKLIELSEDEEFSGYVILVNIMGEFDCEYGYPSKNAQVDNRIAETERLGTNNVHPVINARKLFSDSYYRVLCAIMFQ